jgi:cell division protein FtsB
VKVAPTKADDRKSAALARIAAVVVLTIALVYCLKLAGLALATRQARRTEAAQQAEVARLATQVAALESATRNAASDGYVERWAREERKWAQAGDHVLVPVAATPVATPAGPAPPGAEDPLDRFWSWLNGR